MHDLNAIFQELNRAHFGCALPVPRLSWNSRLSSSAGRFCPGSRNPLRPRAPHIEVATYLREIPEGPMHVRDTVLHEMIHYYLWHERKPYGHTPEFRRIMKKVGAKRWNPVPRERDWKHWYECPSCREGFPTRRRLGISACARCCERHNQGRFHEKFRLVRKPPKPGSAPEAAKPAPAHAAAPAEPRLPAGEVIRRLEELRALVLGKTR